MLRSNWLAIIDWSNASDAHPLSITLKQLAYRLQLSPTTVSRGLNGFTDVSPATRERVTKLARELGYQPNSTARRLSLGRTDAVGVVYPLDAGGLEDPCFLEVIKGLSNRLEVASIDLLLAAAREQSELQTYERLVSGGRVDGVIIARTRVRDPRIEFLQRAGVPFVAYGRTGEPHGYSWLDFDNEAGTVLAVEEIARVGHRHVGYIHASPTFNFAFQRRAGFDRAMRAAGLEIRHDSVVDGGIHRLSGYAAAVQLLTLRPDRPTAIIVDNNLCGIGVVRALLDNRIAIGKEVSVIVYDGVNADSLLLEQRIAAIEQPTPYQAGETLADMLLSSMRGGSREPRQVLYQPVFQAGDSIGPPPV